MKPDSCTGGASAVFRAARFVASLAGSWLAGKIGAALVWEFIYSIGSRVIEDETYYRLHDDVTRWGGIAGVSVGLVIVLLLRRPAPTVLVGAHAFAVVAGFFGGSLGWQQGLWCYFGALGAFAVAVALRTLFRFLSDREYQPRAAIHGH